MKAELTHPCKAGPTEPNEALRGTILPVGTIREGPQAFRLVQCGVAKPADEECRKRAGMTDDEIQAAHDAYPAIEKGITPEDREAFNAGEMDGYNPDGSWVPGENAVQGDDPEEDEDDE